MSIFFTDDIVPKKIKKLPIYMDGLNPTNFPFTLIKIKFMLFTRKCVPRYKKNISLGGNIIMEVLETKYLDSITGCILNWSHMHQRAYSKVVGIILKAREYLIRSHWWHCIIHIFIHAWFTVYMYEVKHTRFIFMISLSYGIRLFAYFLSLLLCTFPFICGWLIAECDPL